MTTFPLTREDLLDEIADAMADRNDIDVGWHQFAEVAVRVLESHGITFDEPAPDRPMRVGGGIS